MTTFSASNLQNEALAKIGVFQHPETREYYYGGKRDADGKVSGEIKIVPKEDAEKLAAEYIKLEEAASKTKAGSVRGLLAAAQITHNQDGNYIDKDGNIIPPQQLLKLTTALLGIEQLSFGTNYRNIKEQGQNLPVMSSEEHEQSLHEASKRNALIGSASTRLFESLIAGYFMKQAMNQASNDPSAGTLEPFNNQLNQFTPIIGITKEPPKTKEGTAKFQIAPNPTNQDKNTVFEIGAISHNLPNSANDPSAGFGFRLPW